MRAEAFAKVNLSLEVGAVADGGLHEVHGLFQSIAWPDSLVLDGADEDRIEGRGSGEVIDGWDNLAWRAATMVRELAQSSRALRIELHKRIPVAAGLGGGSADAAAALGLAGRFFGVSAGALAELAPQIGSDVPFCLGGGLAVVSGTGEKVSTLEPAAGFAMALVVPPIELATVDVYSAWDRLEDQRGPGIADRDLPPSLRSHGPLVNDLYGAAVAVAPAIDEWRAELADRWGRPVMLTGSGPTLFAYFVDTTEAESALDAVPIGARATRAAVPVSSGWQMVNEESRIENRESR